jgi:SAM-dependent methyltransferase
VNTPENSNTVSLSDRAGVGVDWESRYNTGDTPWEKGAPHPALVDWLHRNSLPGRVLVPGCGAGHDVREISRNPASEAVGFDIAPSAIRMAGRFPKVGRETFVLGDFLAGDARRLGPFDALFEHTCFCAIPPSRRVDYTREAASALKSGGLVVGIFYGTPDNPDRDSPPFASPYESVLSQFARDFELLEKIDRLPTYPEREDREYLLVLRRR